MIRKYVLSALALAGFVLAIFTVQAGNRPQPVASPVVGPAQPPYESYVAGAGIVEASTRNIAIGTPVSGLVMKVFVEAGESVKAGAPLLKLDDRDPVAQLAVKQSAVVASKAQLEKLKSYPRAEEVTVAEARVQAAEFAMADAKNQVGLWESVRDKRAVPQEEFDKKRYAASVAEAKYEEASADLALLKAGAWKPDIDIAAAQLASAEAQASQTQTDIDRLTIRAPVDGQILQCNVRAGEYAMAGPADTPLMLLGNVQLLHVRVDVDENDAWRVIKDARAVALLRGNPQFKTDLKFVRFEPYVVPKRSLTGASTERVDTRVLQVIYSFERGDMPVYVGQLMDVYIDAPPAGSSVDEMHASRIESKSGSGERK